MHEPTCSVVIPDLPPAWSSAPTTSAPAPGAPTNSAKLACGHVFHPTALALHFLTSDMRCPVCRKGFSESMDLKCISAADRSCYDKKLKSINLNTRTFEQTLHVYPPACVEDLLNALDLQLSVFESVAIGRELAHVRTRVIYTSHQVLEIEEQQVLLASDSDCVHPTFHFQVHRSFQRLICALANRQKIQHPEQGVQLHSTTPVASLYDQRRAERAERVRQHLRPDAAAQ